MNLSKDDFIINHGDRIAQAVVSPVISGRWARLVKVNNTDKNKVFPIPQNLLKHMLDFLCVCSHYSSRYENADGFLKQCSETKLVEHSFYLFKNPLDTIVDHFIDTKINSSPSSKIDDKNIEKKVVQIYLQMQIVSF